MTLVGRSRRVATSTWSDVLDRLKLEGIVEGLTLRSGSGAICGRAVTVQETIGSFEHAAFAPGKFLEKAGSGSVLVIAGGGENVSTFGGLAALAAKNAGVAGVLIDAACRDVGEIRETGLWLASRHATPRSGQGRIRVDAIDVPVTLSNVLISPGDYIVADETGIVSIPQSRIEEALAIAEDLTEKDAQFAAELRKGASFLSASARTGHV